MFRQTRLPRDEPYSPKIIQLSRFVIHGIQVTKKSQKKEKRIKLQIKLVNRNSGKSEHPEQQPETQGQGHSHRACDHQDSSTRRRNERPH